jgi:hypothetical protein
MFVDHVSFFIQYFSDIVVDLIDDLRSLSLIGNILDLFKVTDLQLQHRSLEF